MGRPKKLLILNADDDPAVRRFMHRALASAGHEVLDAQNGYEALKAARARRPHLAIVDIHMPKGMSGFALCRKLRKDCSTDVFLTTGIMIEKGDRLRAYQSGAIRYFVKPVGVKELVKEIDFYRDGPEFLGPGVPEEPRKETAPARTSPVKILVADGDEKFLSAVGIHLEETAYAPYAARTGYQGVMAAATLKPALVVLGVSLPDIPAAEVIQLLKAHPNSKNIPILAWARSREQGQELVCLEKGAEDFLVRGVDEIGSLPAKIGRLLRGVAGAPNGILERGAVAINTSTRDVAVCGQSIEKLTPREFRLLAYLITQSPRVVPWDEVERDLWSVLPEYLTHSYALESIEVHLRRLRIKLGPAASCLLTHKGVGIQFDPSRSPGPVLP